MKALVLEQAGQDPKLQDFGEPTAAEGERTIDVVAAGLNPYDRYMAQSPHGAPVPRVLGSEGVGMSGGKRVYIDGAVAPFGTIAEKTLVKAGKIIELPDGLAAGQAIAIGISGLAGWLPLSWKAQLKPGESVLVLGATGVQGQIAVQAAKLLGAGRVIAAGRDKAVLESLKSRGADDIIILEGDLAEAIKQGAPKAGFDVVIDSLFGEPFAGLLKSGTLGPGSRVVVLGGSAGQDVSLNFRVLQATKGATIAGYSTFFVPQEIKKTTYLTMAGHIMTGDIKIDIQEFPLDSAEQAWAHQASGPHGKVIVAM